MRPVIAITSAVTADVLALLQSHAEIRMPQDDGVWSSADLLVHAPDASAVLSFRLDRLDARTLAALPRLRILACAQKGSDHVDVAACTRAGVWVTVVPDLLTQPTAELAIGLTIGLARKIRMGDQHVRSGNFTRWSARFNGLGLAGTWIGIAGMGAIGYAIAEHLAGFRARLLYWDQRRLPATTESRLDIWPAGWNELLATSRVLILSLPLDTRSRHIIDAQAIARMQPGALLVNVGRGSLVDEQAVADAIAAGHLGGYAADVFAFEDAPDGAAAPNLPPALLAPEAPTLFTPHLGSAIDSIRREATLIAARNIIAALAGDTPQDAINRPAATLLQEART